MAQKITQTQIDEMIKLYEKLGTYSAVAKEIGVSASTVSKYIKAATITHASLSASYTEPKPITEIPFDMIVSFSTMTDAERDSYFNWLKEFK